MKKKPRKIITFENYITRSGIEYFPKGASYPIKVPSIALKDIMEGLHKYK